MRQLAVIGDYAGLIAALRERAEVLGVSNQTLEATAGLPAGYCGHVLGVKPSRQLGRLSLGLVLGALGVKLIVAEDPEVLERVRGRLVKRRRNGRHRGLRSSG
jgi:hypothetical protein